MATEDSNSPNGGTGLIDGSLEQAQQKFASLLADEDGGNPDEGERPTVDETEAEDLDPNGGTDESEEAGEADDDEDTDDESDDGENQEDEAEPRYTVKADGQEHEVGLSELLRGYSRFQDYHRKTTKLAEERRAFESETEAVKAERQVYSTLLTQLEQQLSGGETPDWDTLYKDDPIEYVRQQQLHMEKQRKLEAVQQEKQRLAEAGQKEQQAQIQALIAEERNKLLAVLPEWSDEKVAKRERAAIKEYATSALGFTAAEVGQIIDHRAVLTLKKAMAYDQLQKGRKELRDKRKPPAARTAMPGSTARPVSQSPDVKARRRLAKTGSVRDAAAVFEQLLD